MFSYCSQAAGSKATGETKAKKVRGADDDGDEEVEIDVEKEARAGRVRSSFIIVVNL
jgi:hypothetical protein